MFKATLEGQQNGDFNVFILYRKNIEFRSLMTDQGGVTGEDWPRSLLPHAFSVQQVVVFYFCLLIFALIGNGI